MMAMVVLCPKMKAPQIRVIIPHVVRTTLRGNGGGVSEKIKERN